MSWKRSQVSTDFFSKPWFPERREYRLWPVLLAFAFLSVWKLTFFMTSKMYILLVHADVLGYDSSRDGDRALNLAFTPFSSGQGTQGGHRPRTKRSYGLGQMLGLGSSRDKRLRAE